MSTVCCSEIDLVSSRGAVPNTSAVTCGWARGSRSQATKAAMPACATSPTQDRSSALSARYQGSSDSIRCSAAVESCPVARRSRVRVGPGTWLLTLAG